MKFLTIAFCQLLLCTTTLAQQVVVLGPDLVPQTTTLDTVSLTDEKLLRVQLGFDALTPLNDKQLVATLVDGQSLVGTFMGTGEDGESIRLAFGYEQRTAVLPLDELVSLAVMGQRLQGESNDDTLLLATGETLIGFVDSISKESVGFIVGDADDPIDIPMQRVLGLTIANKPKPIEPSKGMARVQLRDGSLIYLREAKLTPVNTDQAAGLQGTLVLEPKTTAITLPLEQVHAIEPMSTRYRLLSLTDLPMKVIAGGEVFGVAMPPRFTAEGGLKLHAPVTLGFDLPTGASRLALTIAMDLDDSISASRRAMAGCELVIYAGDNELARHRLTADGPAKRLNVPLTGGELRIKVDSGVNGPVLDRVILTGAQLLVSE